VEAVPSEAAEKSFAAVRGVHVPLRASALYAEAQLVSRLFADAAPSRRACEFRSNHRRSSHAHAIRGSGAADNMLTVTLTFEVSDRI
jgi:hypothetical protein